VYGNIACGIQDVLIDRARIDSAFVRSAGIYCLIGAHQKYRFRQV
jgi:hypothetical protein